LPGGRPAATGSYPNKVDRYNSNNNCSSGRVAVDIGSVASECLYFYVENLWALLLRLRLRFLFLVAVLMSLRTEIQVLKRLPFSGTDVRISVVPLPSPL